MIDMVMSEIIHHATTLNNRGPSDLAQIVHFVEAERVQPRRRFNLPDRSRPISADSHHLMATRQDGDVENGCKQLLNALDLFQTNGSKGGRVKAQHLYNSVQQEKPTHPLMKEIAARIVLEQ